MLNLDPVAEAAKLWRVWSDRSKGEAFDGMYEVLEYDAALELLDKKGRQAVYKKYQKVRFLQNNIIAYQDQAWGDGDIFAEYKCSPGVAVDRYREGHRWRILISLRETKQRGDIEEFHIERRMRNSFMTHTEEWQTEVAHVTQHLTVKLIFPAERPPKQVWLAEQNTGQTIELGPQHMQQLADGRYQVAWRTAQPKLFEAYILRWKW